MKILAISIETGDVLSRTDTDNMRLPFTTGWSAWGVYDEAGDLIEAFPSYPQANDFVGGQKSHLPLAA